MTTSHSPYPQPGDESLAHPVNAWGVELLAEDLADPNVLVALHGATCPGAPCPLKGGHQMALVLWSRFQGATLAPTWHAKAVLVLTRRPNLDLLTWRARVWLERELALKACPWAMANVGTWRLVYVQGAELGQGYWKGAHIDEAGQARLYTWAYPSALQALQALERIEDLLEVSDQVEAEQLARAWSAGGDRE